MMELLKKKELEQPINQEPEYLKAFKQIFQKGVDIESSGGFSVDDAKDIENMKLIIFAILNDDLLESLTNLTPDEIDDINDALFLNEYFDNPRILIFIMHRLKLSRSIVANDDNFKNLLNIFSDISGKSIKNLNPFSDMNTLGNRFGKR